MREHIIAKLYQMDIDSSYEPKNIPKGFVHDAITTIVTNFESVNDTLETHLIQWKLKRLSYVDRAILRLGVYELAHTSTPTEVIIDELLNLTHKFSDEGDKKHVAFNNRVLENLAKSLREMT